MFESFNVKKFLSLPLNNGKRYIESNGSCGCIKGNFVASLDEFHCDSIYYESSDSNYYVPIPRMFSRLAVNTSSPEFLQNIDLKMLQILNLAEDILLYREKPQRAKLFLVRALRKYGYIPKETITQEVAHV
jgi:hypothetical protein